jgi:hypothetical protein
MSMTNTFESGVLALLFQNLALTGLGNAGGLLPSSVAGNLWISLHTANPDEAGDQTTHETVYPGYARISVVRSAVGWTLSGTAPTQVVNAADISFPACTSGGETVSHFGIGTDQTGAGKLALFNALTSPLVVSVGKAPTFLAGQLKATLD